MDSRGMVLAIIFGLILAVVIEPFRGYFELAILAAMAPKHGSGVYTLLKYGVGPLGGAIGSGVICIFLGILLKKRIFVFGILSGAIGAILIEVINAHVMSEHIAVFLEGAAVVVGSGIGALLGNWLKLRVLSNRNANVS